MKRSLRIFIPTFLFLALLGGVALGRDIMRLRVETRDVWQRTAIADMGMDIESVNLADGSIIVLTDEAGARRIVKAGFEVRPMAELAYPADMDGYHDEAEVVAALDGYAASYPQILKKFSIGTTVEGRDLWTVKISNNPQVDDDSKPGLLVAALYHAREPASLEVALDLIAYLVEAYGQDEYLTWMIDNREIYIVPRTNPDGHTYDVDNGLVLWRKNRSATGNPACPGVDLNRNFSVHFGGPGSSPYACEETYHGASAFSELETQAIRDLILDRPNLNLVIDLHTYGGMILYPWSYTLNPIPNADLAVHSLLGSYISAMTGYVSIPSAELYLAAGASVDWEYSEAGRTAFTIELTGTPEEGNFYLPDTILPDLFQTMRPVWHLAVGVSEDPSMILDAGIWDLTAAVDGSDVTVSWKPIVEDDGGGYAVLRSLSRGGPYEEITNALLPFGQAEYSHLDPGLETDHRYWYEVEYRGQTRSRTFGPVPAVIGNAPPIDDDTADDDTFDDDTADDDAVDDTGDDAADDTGDDAVDDDAMDDAGDDAIDDTADDTTDDDQAVDDAGDDTAADDTVDDDSGIEALGNGNGSSSSSSGCGC